MPIRVTILALLSNVLALAISPTARALDLAPFQVHSSENHEIQVLQNGPAALLARLQMIERAQNEIDLEYFIYKLDTSGRLVTQALYNKKIANPNIRIRLLVDGSLTFYDLTRELTDKLVKAGIEVRYYNPAPVLQLIKAQYRNHRKLILIDSKDGLEAITGGRNIADEYFDLNKRFNFIDKDLWLRGPMVQAMRETFEFYWGDNHTRPVPKLGPPPYPQLYRDESLASARRHMDKESADYYRRIDVADDILTENESDRAIRAQLNKLAQPILDDEDSRGQCNNLSYVTDQPGFEVGNNKASPKRRVYKAIVDRIGQMQQGERLWIESPYFIVRDRNSVEILRGLPEKDVKASLLTNGLSSTDAFFVAANFIPRASAYRRSTAADLYLYSGHTPNSLLYLKDQYDENFVSRRTKFGIHSKTFVFGGNSFAIGTFNIDPRSANINSEMLVFCENNPMLTNFVLKGIQSEVELSRQLKEDGEPIDGKGVLYDSNIIKKMAFFLSLLPATLFDYLL